MSGKFQSDSNLSNTLNFRTSTESIQKEKQDRFSSINGKYLTDFNKSPLKLQPSTISPHNNYKASETAPLYTPPRKHPILTRQHTPTRTTPQLNAMLSSTQATQSPLRQELTQKMQNFHRAMENLAQLGHEFERALLNLDILHTGLNSMKEQQQLQYQNASPFANFEIKNNQQAFNTFHGCSHSHSYVNHRKVVASQDQTEQLEKLQTIVQEINQKLINSVQQMRSVESECNHNLSSLQSAIQNKKSTSNNEEKYKQKLQEQELLIRQLEHDRNTLNKMIERCTEENQELKIQMLIVPQLQNQIKEMEEFNLDFESKRKTMEHSFSEKYFAQEKQITGLNQQLLIVQQDKEEIRLNLVSVQQENRTLKLEYASMQQQGQQCSNENQQLSQRFATLQQEQRQLQQENSNLLEKIQILQEETGEEKRQLQQKIVSLQEEWNKQILEAKSFSQDERIRMQQSQLNESRQNQEVKAIKESRIQISPDTEVFQAQIKELKIELEKERKMKRKYSEIQILNQELQKQVSLLEKTQINEDSEIWRQRYLQQKEENQQLRIDFEIPRNKIISEMNNQFSTCFGVVKDKISQKYSANGSFTQQQGHLCSTHLTLQKQTEEYSPERIQHRKQANLKIEETFSKVQFAPQTIFNASSQQMFNNQNLIASKLCQPSQCPSEDFFKTNQILETKLEELILLKNQYQDALKRVTDNLSCPNSQQ